MITEAKFAAILTTLLEKSGNNKVIWHEKATRRGTVFFQVEFTPDIAINVGYEQSPSSPDTVYASLNIGEKVAVSILAEESTVSGEPDPNYVLIKQLYVDAERSSYHVDEALATIEASLASILPTGTSEEHPSATPTENNVLVRLAGTWNLDFSIGDEMVRIDATGNYFIVAPEQKQEICHFTLEQVTFDPAASAITFRKVDTGVPPNSIKGRFHSTESLKVSNNWHTMTGVDSPFCHKLKYTRLD
jgi:hypothetical protein